MSEMLTTKEVAERCRVTPRTVLNWANAGIIGAKLGGVWRFKESAVQQMIRNGERKCQSTNAAVSGGSRFSARDGRSVDPLDQALDEWHRNSSGT